MVLNCSVHAGLSHSLGVLDGSIQGAEEGSTFLHHTVEMHLVQEVTLGITEILGAKPGQNRQADISGRPQERSGVGTDIISVFYNSVSIPTNNSNSRSRIHPWIGGHLSDGRDEASSLQPGLQKYCTAPSLMCRTATLPCKPQSKTHHITQDMSCAILEQMAKRAKPAQRGVTAHPLLRFSGLPKCSTNTCDFRKLQNHRESRKQVRNTGRKDLKLNKGILHN